MSTFQKQVDSASIRIMLIFYEGILYGDFDTIDYT